VVVPERSNRIRNELVLLAIVVLIAGIAGGIYFNDNVLMTVSIFLAVVFFLLGIYRSFKVRIPEGVNGLLARGGRYTRTIGSGTHVIPPWIVISHLVTRREIPFDVPVVEAITEDNVRANADVLVTFSIGEPYRFVYSISADDFDQVFQATCQDALRSEIRQIDSDQVADLVRKDLSELRTELSNEVDPYGITIMKVAITYAQPPAEFMATQEARKLAMLQQAEHAEKQVLVRRRQTDEEELARQRVIAEVGHDREALQSQVQEAETLKRLVELEAEAEELRLARLEERLKNYPKAAQWEVETLQLEIGRALAGNTRAVLQVGSASDITRAFVMRDLRVDPSLADTDGDSSGAS
jgi:regulator of protease activity HflC (stomatin/prohibitin superfamily)